jgi:hypothetical protein
VKAGRCHRQCEVPRPTCGSTVVYSTASLVWLADVSERWQCLFFVEHLLPLRRTPLFVLQSERDLWQLEHIACAKVRMVIRRCSHRRCSPIVTGRCLRDTCEVIARPRKACRIQERSRWCVLAATTITTRAPSG